MTLKTLNVIHQMLSKEVNTRYRIYKAARKAYSDSDYDEGLKAPVDEAWKSWDEARMALCEFEDKEWR